LPDVKYVLTLEQSTSTDFYEQRDMGMEGDQITEGLHKQDISGFAPWRDLSVDLVQQSGDNPSA
jgi:hypothetical protein